MPCDDETLVGDATEFHQVDQTQASGMAADDCSPFCQCHCCHIHITNFEGEDAELISLEISTQVSAFRNDMGDDIPRSFFQPPQV